MLGRGNKAAKMAAKTTLIVRFTMNESAKAEFIKQLQDVFRHIEREETFVKASLQQDLQDPKSILVYEVWLESPESFIKNQMAKDYRRGYEQAIVDLKVERVPSWYSSIIEWKKA
jgi:quinol monooxygenase YgiN